jgi:hypothetical protein
LGKSLYIYAATTKETVALSSITNFQKKIQLYSPLRLNFFVVLIALVVLQIFLGKLQQSASTDGIAYANVFNLMWLIASRVFAAITIVMLISVLLSWLLFNNKQSNVQLSFIEHSTDNLHRTALHVLVQKITMPLMGVVQAALHFNNKEYSPIFNLSSSNKLAWWRRAINSEVQFNMPISKTYHVEFALFLFRDAFGFFCLHKKVPAQNTLLHLPPSKTEHINLQPNTSSEAIQRVPQQRRIDGDFLRFKKFDTGDDTRRIVWRIFARNKDLQVRTPEIFNPFADELRFYPSFYTTISLSLQDELLQVLLTKYKSAIYGLIKGFQGNDTKLVLHSDQQHSKPTQADAHTTSTIVDSEWHSKMPLQFFASTRKKCLICIHSLSNPEDAQQYLSTCTKDTEIVYVDLASVIRTSPVKTLIEKIFLIPSEDYIKQLSNTWSAHSLSRKIQNNEKELLKILEQSNKTIHKI